MFKMFETKGLLVCALLATFAGLSVADTPANCTYTDAEGEWVLYETERNLTSSLTCQPEQLQDPVVHEVTVTLKFPNVAVDNFGNVGYWTIIYNQGFEVTVNGRTYFSFAYYNQTQNGNGRRQTHSYCHRTFTGWSHDVTARNWACFYGRKTLKRGEKESVRVESIDENEDYSESEFKTTAEYVETINKIQNEWTAAVYPEFEKLTDEEKHMMLGGGQTIIKSNIPTAAEVTPELLQATRHLPKSWDWRNVDGINYVSPVRDQKQCGSCYAFAVMGMLEARVRIQTNNTQQPIFSPQDIVSCSPYAQGCAGGFNYLIGGTHAKDFGVVEEECNKYIGRNTATCTTTPECRRHYVSDYSYLGGFFGGCNEPLMRQSLVENGPLAVSYLAGRSFFQYKSGIYYDIDNEIGVNKFDPFKLLNHAVLIVGYGTDEKTGRDFWIVKNSWGSGFGEKGYFRIRRGTNERAIEGFAFEATVIPA